MPSPIPALPTMLRGLLFLIAYVLLDALSYIHPVAGLAITPWNPHFGLLLAAFIWYGYGFLPVALLAALVSEGLVRGTPHGDVSGLLLSLLAPLGYAWTASLLRRLEFDARLPGRDDLTRLLLVVTPATLVIAVAFVWSHTLLGHLHWRDLPVVVLHSWIGDLIGVVVTTSLLLIWRHTRWRELLADNASAPAAQVVLVLAVLALWMVFGRSGSEEYQFFYLLFVPLIVAAIRWGLRGASLVLQLVQLGLVAALLLRSQSADVLVSFQFLMLAMAVTGLYLGMAVTEGRRAQEVLLKREAELHNALRVAAAGELASSLAHELNQPLSAVSTYSQVSLQLLDRLPAETPRLADTLQKMAAEARRAGQVVHRLRRFFRSGELHVERISVAELISQAREPLARRLKSERVELLEHLPADLPDVRVDRVQIEIVLHNLLGNALEAIVSSESERRLLVVSAEAQDRQVRICVTDTGPGIDELVAARLFEPFATGKAKGMGLGLNISRSLVEAHGGRLVLAESRPGRTRFCFTLPIAEEGSSA